MSILDAVVFYTNNIEIVVDFYTNMIGLKLEYQSDDNYASLLFDNDVKLGIKKATEEREIPGAQTMSLVVKDAKAEYELARQKGLIIHKHLIEEDWAIEFSILDPDGNKIEFVQSR